MPRTRLWLYPVSRARQNSKILLLPSSPLPVGGTWHSGIANQVAVSSFRWRCTVFSGRVFGGEQFLVVRSLRWWPSFGAVAQFLLLNTSYGLKRSLTCTAGGTGSLIPLKLAENHNNHRPTDPHSRTAQNSSSILTKLTFFWQKLKSRDPIILEWNLMAHGSKQKSRNSFEMSIHCL